MLVAKQKRKENIVEYILYLFQIEDLIRAFQFDMDLIEKNVVSNYHADKETLVQVSGWYENLLAMMAKEGLREKGHLQFLLNLISESNQLHLNLLTSPEQNNYLLTFQSVAGLLTELKLKNPTADNDIQLAFDAVYGYLLLKMQKKEVSSETTDAVQRLNPSVNFITQSSRNDFKNACYFPGVGQKACYF